MLKVQNVLVVGGNYGIENMFRSHAKYHVLADASRTKPDLVCFTGGEDVDPHLYSHKRLVQSRFNERRDKQDIEAYNKYPETPKVGICRGGQFLNVMSGGTMYQHVSNHTRDHKMQNLLKVKGIEWDEINVTSTHHQMMIAGKDGDIIAIVTDGKKGISEHYVTPIVTPLPKFDTEVVWYGKTKSLCYQPHPEYHTNPMNRIYFFALLEHFFFPPLKESQMIGEVLYKQPAPETIGL